MLADSSDVIHILDDCSTGARTIEELTCFKLNEIKRNGLHGPLLTPKTEHNEWASYQIRKIAVCACAGNAGNVFPHRRFRRKPLVSDPGMHHGTCVTHVPWCMSGSLTCGGGENVPGIPGACAPAILRIWQEAHAKYARFHYSGDRYGVSNHRQFHYLFQILFNLTAKETPKLRIICHLWGDHRWLASQRVSDVESVTSSCLAYTARNKNKTCKLIMGGRR